MTIVVLASWIALEKRPPVATLAWILLVILLPGAGLVLYYFLGYRRVHKSRLKRLRARLGLKAAKDRLRAGAGPMSLPGAPPELAEVAQFSASELPAHTIAAMDAAMNVIRAPESRRSLALVVKTSTDPVRDQQLMTLGTMVSDSPPSTATRVDILVDGDETYAAILEAIAKAEHHIHLEYYIYEPDQIGTRLRDALVERAKAGVEVLLLVDGVGSRSLSRKFLAPLREAGARFAWYGQVRLARLRPRMVNFRTHRKIVVVDGKVGFTGGLNITDTESPAASGPRAFRDTHQRLEGAVVRWLDLVFLEDWHHATGHAPTDPKYFPDSTPGDHVVQILSSGPDQPLMAIQKLYFSAICGAHARVWITTPYFVPDEAMLAALMTAALRGVDVRLLLPRHNDLRIVAAAARSYFAELVAVGVRIYEYTPRMLHSKTMVIDDDLAAIGTANMDSRSFRLNFEVTSVAYDPRVAAALAKIFEKDLETSREITQGALANEKLPSKIVSAAARLLSPLL